MTNEEKTMAEANNGIRWPTDPARRYTLNRMTTGERAIYEAMQTVDEMGVDVRLKDAVVLLYEAMAAVADYVDDVTRRRSVKVTVDPDLPRRKS